MIKKNLYFLLVSVVIPYAVMAQKVEKAEEPAFKKNIIKLNLFALGLKNFTVQYERAVSKKISVAATFRFMPKGGIPLKSTFIKMADDSDTERQINNLEVGNFAFMPEVRFYLGKKGALRGFYLGLFGNIASYTATVPIQYEDNAITKSIPMSGKLTGITGGLMIGKQFRMSNKIYIDWWLFGPNYGTSKGTLSGQKTMDAAEQKELSDELASIDIPLTKFTYNVNGSGATMDFKGPWGGLRSGLCIGFRF